MTLVKKDSSDVTSWTNGDAVAEFLANPANGRESSSDISAKMESSIVAPSSLGTFTAGGDPLTAIKIQPAVIHHNPVEPDIVGGATLTVVPMAEAEFDALGSRPVKIINAPVAASNLDAIAPSGVGHVFSPSASVECSGILPAAIIGGATITATVGEAEINALDDNEAFPIKILDVTISTTAPVANIQHDALVPSGMTMSISAPVAEAQFDVVGPSKVSLQPIDIEITFPALTCQLYGANQIDCTFPSLTFTADVNYREIEAELPMFTMTGNIYVGRSADIDATLPSIEIESYSGSYVEATLPMLEIDVDVSSVTVVDVSATIPSMLCDIDVTDTTPATMSATLRPLRCTIDVISGGVGDVTASLPALMCDIDAGQPMLIDIISRLPRMKCDIDVSPSGDDELDIDIPMITCNIKSCNSDNDGVQRHVMDLEYLEADMPMPRIYAEAS